ncbi:2-oxo acid dehydrogenase subunit E2 [Enterobacteriaceae endosymbiont of Neohaemonia nigricornis]|uniref:2-oxo acid dehydrogenase subunit E2 n=1 Tax=Enterobacteriaceae endosymbiont of Neohaemonia nigricornis TaxID=2675792 RepID=UPI00144A2133|nr:2-oxo acid dehydrogenase subunit E2 [Enterobacteriaceae endosymbiont of Neohaemonia nigricornis]QJC30402.1 hypothetical protein GJT85_01060 [Enterobacteriaceae endosymbiont of Neohaemonia nigricornis]
MNKNIILPDIGNEDMKVTDILVKEGEFITKDQSIIIVESDKTSMEIPTNYSGIIQKILVSVGDIVHTDSLILTIKDNNTKNTTHKIQEENINKIFSQNILVPDIGTKSMVVKQILVQKNSTINKNQSLIIIYNDNHTIEIASLYAGYVKKINIKINDIIHTNDIIIVLSINTINNNITNNQTSFIKTNNIIKTNTLYNQEQYFNATPIIRKMAREFKIDLSEVKGSGNKNRITKEDILKFSTQKTDINNVSELHANINNYKQYGNIEKIYLNHIQKITSVNLTNNWKNIPHVTQHIEVDITQLEKFRVEKNKEFQNTNSNVKLTLLSFIIKICAYALKKYPYFNSSLLDKETLIIKKYYNIGIAINTKQGLMVPVIFDVLNKSIIDIAQEIILLSQKAQKKQLIPKNMQGGCFTISNLGGIRSNFFTPIINAPEVAILGISQSIIKPVWDSQKFIPKLMLPLSLSYDHRVINGVDGIIFLNYICNLIHDIRNILMYN